MQVMREASLVIVLLSCIAAGVGASLENGLPRPSHVADEPTTSYGPYPELMDDIGAFVDCEWYGFANTLYSDDIGLDCLDEMRVALTNATENPPTSMRPYQYYTLRRMMDPVTSDWYCYQGCFNLNFQAPPALSPAYAPGPDFVEGPAMVPAPTPDSYDGPAMAPVVVDAPNYSPFGSPAFAPAPESGL